MNSFDDPEVVWRLKKKYYAGLIIASQNYERIEELIKSYTERFYNEFFTSAPVSEKPTE